MKLPAFQRDIVGHLKRRMGEKRRFIQVVTGPRQTGKTTAVLQVLRSLPVPSVYAAADSPAPPGVEWIEARWNEARLKSASGESAVLVLDEIQKINRWDEAVKALWDDDTREGRELRVVLLGSTALLMRSGLRESLAGRFETLYCTHWSWPECRACFGWNLEQYIYFGGYPGAAPLISDQERWMHYIRESLIETTISRDVLLLNRVTKPALLHQLFYLACEYAGRILSYNKILGQLADAGNATTLAHYQSLLEEAFILRGLPKWTGTALRRRASSPKWLPLNTALITAVSGMKYEEWRKNPDLWGRLVEAAVGGHLVNRSSGRGWEVYYWRQRDREVDYVISGAGKVTGIEVKSGRPQAGSSGLKAFKKAFPSARILMVGSGGIPLEEFFELDPASLLL